MSSEPSELQKMNDVKRDYEDSLRIYHEYKKLRRQLGKSTRAFDDRDAILKDLLGEGFPILKEEVERAKKRQKAKSRSIGIRPSY